MTVTVRAVTGGICPAEIRLSTAGESLTCTLASVPDSDTASVTVHLRCPSARPWGLLDPHLYLLRTELIREGRVVDDLIDRIGFRTIRTDSTRLLLNDAPVFLKGFNRHEDHGNAGCAVSVGAMM